MVDTVGHASEAEGDYWANTTLRGLMGATRTLITPLPGMQLKPDYKGNPFWVEGIKNGHLHEPIIGLEIASPDHDRIDVNYTIPLAHGGKLTLG